jgi:hypothetical protein
MDGPAPITCAHRWKDRYEPRSDTLRPAQDGPTALQRFSLTAARALNGLGILRAAGPPGRPANIAWQLSPAPHAAAVPGEVRVCSYHNRVGGSIVPDFLQVLPRTLVLDGMTVIQGNIRTALPEALQLFYRNRVGRALGTRELAACQQRRLEGTQPESGARGLIDSTVTDKGMQYAIRRPAE